MPEINTWQVALIGLATTCVAAVGPSIAKVIEYKAIKDTGANLRSPDDVPFAKQQTEIWQRNIDCIGLPQRWFDAGNIKFTAIFCPDTGDILVQYKLSNGGKQHVHWIEEDARRSQKQATSFLLAPALASTSYSQAKPFCPIVSDNAVTLISQEFKSIFQKVISQGIIIRITQKTDGQCSRQTINSYSGQLKSEPIGQCSFGYCTLLPTDNSSKRIINDRCIIGRSGSSKRDLTWSSGQAMRVNLNPPSVDGKLGRLIQPHATGGTIKISSGNVGWCWDCKP